MSPPQTTVHSSLNGNINFDRLFKINLIISSFSKNFEKETDAQLYNMVYNKDDTTKSLYDKFWDDRNDKKIKIDAVNISNIFFNKQILTTEIALFCHFK